MEETEIKNFKDNLLKKYIDLGTLNFDNKISVDTKLKQMEKLKLEIMNENIDFVNNIIYKYHTDIKPIDPKIKNDIQDFITSFSEFKKDFNTRGFWNETMKKINKDIGSDRTKNIYNSIVRDPINKLIKNWNDIKKEIKPIYKLSRDLDTTTMTQKDVENFKNQLLSMKNSIIFNTKYNPYRRNNELKYIDTSTVDLSNLFTAIVEIEDTFNYDAVAKTFDNFNNSVSMDIDEIEEIEEVDWFDNGNSKNDSMSSIYTLTMIYIQSILEKISTMFNIETFTTTPISSNYLNNINNNINNVQTLLLLWYFNKLNGCFMIANNKFYKLDICNNYYTSGKEQNDSYTRQLNCSCSTESDTSCNNPNNCLKPYCIGNNLCNSNGLNCSSDNSNITLKKCSDTNDSDTVSYFYKDFDIYSTIFNIADISSYIKIGPKSNNFSKYLLLYIGIGIILIILIILYLFIFKKNKKSKKLKK